MIKWFGKAKNSDQKESVLQELRAAGYSGLTTVEIQWAKGLPEQKLQQLLSDLETEDRIRFQNNRWYLNGIDQENRDGPGSSQSRLERRSKRRSRQRRPQE